MHREEGKFHPFDQATKDPSLVRFRARLWKAVQEKDVSYLSDVLDDQIRIGFDDQNGKKAFIQKWNLYSNPKKSKLWTELSQVLNLGGAFSENSNLQFCAPYIFNLNDIEDPFEQGIILGEGVRLREAPELNAKIITALNWEKVDLLAQSAPKKESINGETHYWQKIKTNKDITGFVFGKYLRVPVDYRICWEKKDEKWKIISFLAGD